MKDSLKELAKSTNNNFNLIRMIAASMVIVAHSYPLSGIEATTFFDKNIGIHLGEYAVNIFFAISGFLVTRSFMNKPYLLVFARARAFRLIPGLAGSVIFAVFVVGPIFTQVNLADYFSDSQTYEYLYNNISLRHIEYSLPGVFVSTPHEGVNGSLWSLRPEMKMYMILAAFGSLGLLFKKRGLYILTMLYTVFYFSIIYHPEWYENLDKIQVTQRISLYFFLGAIAYMLSGWVRLNFKIAFLLLIMPFLATGTQFFNLTFALCLVYWIFYLAYFPSGKIHYYNKIGDYSYGTYVYGFLVQQIVVSVWPSVSLSGMIFLSLLLTLPFAIVSWHWIENPALSFVKGLNKISTQEHVNKGDGKVIKSA